MSWIKNLRSMYLRSIILYSETRRVVENEVVLLATKEGNRVLYM